MTVRGQRYAVFLPVVVTLLLAGVVGALVVVQDQRDAERVSRADEAAENFLSDVGGFRATVVARLEKAPDTDPGALRRALRSVLADPPQLEDAPAVGVERSDAYAKAVETERTFLRPYRHLSRELRRADVALDFVAAARTALAVKASDYVGFGLLQSSAGLRNGLIPASVRARDTFAAVEVPDGQEELARTVRSALQYVVDQATTMADSIDANRSFSFSYADRFEAARAAVDGYATTVEGDLTEALTAVTGDRP